MSRQDVLKFLSNSGVDKKRKPSSSFYGTEEALSVTLRRNIVGYKKVKTGTALFSSTAIVKLLIPAGAKVICGEAKDGKFFTTVQVKLRTNLAKVMYIQDTVTKKKMKFGYASHDNYKYTAGSIVKPTNYFNSTFRTCASGIHFFLTKEEAQSYRL